MKQTDDDYELDYDDLYGRETPKHRFRNEYKRFFCDSVDRLQINELDALAACLKRLSGVQVKNILEENFFLSKETHCYECLVKYQDEFAIEEAIGWIVARGKGTIENIGDRGLDQVEGFFKKLNMALERNGTYINPDSRRSYYRKTLTPYGKCGTGEHHTIKVELVCEDKKDDTEVQHQAKLEQIRSK